MDSGFGVSELAAALLGALIGAVSGAVLSWKLGQVTVDRATKKQNLRSLRRTILVVCMYNDYCWSLWCQHLEEHYDKPDRDSRLPEISVDLDPPILDVNSILFLIEEKAPQLLLEVQQVRDFMSSVVGHLRRRNEIQRELRERSKFLSVDPQTGRSEVVQPIELAVLSRQVTDSVYESTRETLSLTVKLISRLQEVHSLSFPGEKPLNIELGFKGWSARNASASRS
ncbi:MAG: hypothetical protein AAGK09_03900 [Planctomycetota bacterium]